MRLTEHEFVQRVQLHEQQEQRLQVSAPVPRMLNYVRRHWERREYYEDGGQMSLLY